MALRDRLRSLARTVVTTLRRVSRTTPEPTPEPAPTTRRIVPTRPRPDRAPRFIPTGEYRRVPSGPAGPRNHYGGPTEMGDAEIALFNLALSGVPRSIAVRILDDPDALRYYHLAFFGFRERISRSDMGEWERLFYRHMALTYGINWDSIFSWSVYRRLYGTRAERYALGNYAR